MKTNQNLFSKVRDIQKRCWDIDRQTHAYKADMANWDTIYVTRKLSIWITYVLRHSPLTPNTVTAFWVGLGLLSAVLLIPHLYGVSLLAVLLLYLTWILDNVDGELARYKQQFSIAGNLLDMLGHEIIFSTVFACLTFSMILQHQSTFYICTGLLATVFVTPMTKIQENVKLLLCLQALSQGHTLERAKPSMPSESDSEAKDREFKLKFKFISKSVVSSLVAILFSQTGMMYLLIIAVLCKIEPTYLAFYGIGLPLLFVPKYLARSKELVEISENLDLLSRLFRPKWLDS